MRFCGVSRSTLQRRNARRIVPHLTRAARVLALAARERAARGEAAQMRWPVWGIPSTPSLRAATLRLRAGQAGRVPPERRDPRRRGMSGARRCLLVPGVRVRDPQERATSADWAECGRMHLRARQADVTQEMVIEPRQLAHAGAAAHAAPHRVDHRGIDEANRGAEGEQSTAWRRSRIADCSSSPPPRRARAEHLLPSRLLFRAV